MHDALASITAKCLSSYDGQLLLSRTGEDKRMRKLVGSIETEKFLANYYCRQNRLDLRKFHLLTIKIDRDLWKQKDKH